MSIRLYREWLCTGCSRTWSYQPLEKGNGRPSHCSYCYPGRGPLPDEKSPSGTRDVIAERAAEGPDDD